MAGNSYGKLFRVTTFGESHGRGVGVVIDGVKPNIKISEKEIQAELDRRRPGQSDIVSGRAETDKVEIISGIFEGKTLGTPVCLMVRNMNARSEDYDELRDIFRPGHADLTYFMKYGIYDHRGGGRASGRETIGRVAAGAVAKKILGSYKIRIIGYTKSVGNIIAKKIDYNQIEKNPLRCPDKQAAGKMEKLLLRTMSKKDSLGGIVEAVIKNCPPGLGEPVFDKLEADFAKALMSIPAVRGFEIGSGFSSSKMRGSENNDEMIPNANKKIGFKSNNAGGILGGISTGEDIILRIAVKPPSSIAAQQLTIDRYGRKRKIAVHGRHDACICPRIVPVAEAMISLVILDHLMRTKTVK